MVRRLLLTYIGLALLTLLALAVPLGIVAQRGEEQRTLAQLEHEAEVLAAFVDAAMGRGHQGQIDLLVYEFRERRGAMVDVADATGRVVSTTRTAEPDPAARADLRAVLVGHERVVGMGPDATGAKMMSIAVPVHPGKPEQGAVRVSAPTAPMNARVQQFWGLIGGVSVMVLLGGAVIAVALARWIGRPVRLLERATRRLADGSFPASAFTVTGPPELRRLAATLEATADRLQDVISAQASFIGHASHQLKTPLAALRLRLENAELDVGEPAGANVRAALRETDRLATLVDTLLAMTRSDRGGQPREPVGLHTAVTGRIASWGPLARLSDVSIESAGPADVQVMAPPGAVEQILDNLLSNALAVAPAGSSVTVRWDEGGEIHVVDAGPGLSASERAQAWEPFWRASDAKPGGTGLGLALVQRLVAAADGQVRLDAVVPTGIDAVVTLPVTNARNVPGAVEASAAH